MAQKNTLLAKSFDLKNISSDKSTLSETDKAPEIKKNKSFLKSLAIKGYTAFKIHAGKNIP